MFYFACVLQLEMQLDMNWCLRQRLNAANTQIDQITRLLNRGQNSFGYLEERLSIEARKHVTLTGKILRTVHANVRIAWNLNFLVGDTSVIHFYSTLLCYIVTPWDVTDTAALSHVICGLQWSPGRSRKHQPDRLNRPMRTSPLVKVCKPICQVIDRQPQPVFQSLPAWEKNIPRGGRSWSMGKSSPNHHLFVPFLITKPYALVPHV